jgi:hypothetical protein
LANDARPAPPMPPLERRLTVGLFDTEPFENRSGDPVVGDELPPGEAPIGLVRAPPRGPAP